MKQEMKEEIKNRINKFKGNNYELTTQDIPGCCVGSLKKGIVTKRCTNPLNPDYQFLGAKELAGSKFGEYSKKQRAKSVSNINTMDNNRIKSPQIKEETKNYENVNENNINNSIDDDNSSEEIIFNNNYNNVNLQIGEDYWNMYNKNANNINIKSGGDSPTMKNSIIKSNKEKINPIPNPHVITIYEFN